MMRPHLLFFAALSMSLLAVDGTAFCADPKTDAAQRYKEGLARFKAHDYEGARSAFSQAYLLDSQTKYLWDLAVSEAKGDHPADGLNHFREYFARPDANEANHDKGRKVMDEAASRTGHVVVTTDAGAMLSMDGHAATLLATDSTVDVMPGPHDFEARVGTRSASGKVEPKAGETVRLELHVQAEPPPPAPALAPAPAQTTTPPPALDVPPSDASGAHFWTPMRTTGAITAGVGVASLIAGGVFVAQTTQDSSRVSSAGSSLHGASACFGQQSADCQALSSAQNDQSRDYTLSLVFLTFGAVATAAGATMFFWPHHTGTSATLVPVVSPAGGGLILRGEL